MEPLEYQEWEKEVKQRLWCIKALLDNPVYTVRYLMQDKEEIDLIDTVNVEKLYFTCCSDHKYYITYAYFEYIFNKISIVKECKPEEVFTTSFYRKLKIDLI